MRRQEFTLTEEGRDAGTDMERGQLLTLSALSSHSLPAPSVEGDAGGIALQPVAGGKKDEGNTGAAQDEPVQRATEPQP